MKKIKQQKQTDNPALLEPIDAAPIFSKSFEFKNIFNLTFLFLALFIGAFFGFLAIAMNLSENPNIAPNNLGEQVWEAFFTMVTIQVSLFVIYQIITFFFIEEKESEPDKKKK